MLHPEDVFKIEKNIIIAKKECSIIINTQDYDQRTFIETSSFISIPGILQFHVPEYNDYCQLSILYSIKLIKMNDIKYDKHNITINYVPDDIVIKSKYTTTEPDIGFLMQLLNGRIKYISDPKILLNMAHSILPEVDLVHLELIISNMFRYKDDLNNRCRLTGNYKNSTIIGVAAQPFQDSWASAMAFHHINKAIKNGLIHGKDCEENPIEKIIYEKFKEI
jgi:hypothetical protein